MTLKMVLKLESCQSRHWLQVMLCGACLFSVISSADIRKLSTTDVSLDCPFVKDNFTEVLPTWYLGDTPITRGLLIDENLSNSTRNRYTFNNETFSLEIINTLVTDTGIYTCIGSHLAVAKYNLTVYDMPNPPEMQSVVVINSSAIRISWTPPSESPFVITGYDIIVSHLTTFKMEQHVGGDMTSTVFGNLTADTKYFISASACVQDICSRPSDQLVAVTLEDKPSRPNLLPVTERTSDSITLIWLRPTDLNGVLRGYYIYWQRQNEDEENVFNYTVARATAYTIVGLEPWTKYTISIQAYNDAGVSARSEPYPTYTERIAPSEPLNVSTPDVNMTAIIVTWVQPERITGHVDTYRIRYRPQGRSTSESGWTYLTVNNEYPKKYHRKVVGQLQAGTLYAIQVQAITNSYFPPKTPLLGPYSIEIQTSTSPQEETGEEEKDKGSNSSLIGAIVGVVVTFFVLLILVIGFVFMRKHMNKKNSRYLEVNQCGDSPIGLNDVYGESLPVREDIPVAKFAEHVTKNHANNDLIFSEEFDDINQTSLTDLTVKHSLDPDNVRVKNRYVNILAYDHSRVILRPASGIQGDSSYINANYIDGYQKPRCYVATQGPLVQTASDFWRMVWELNSPVIFMITNLVERGRRKCDQYWPNEGESQYGAMTVRLLNECVTAHYTLRKLILKCGKEARISVRKRGHAERVINQFHFTEWPDHGVPDYTLPVLQFINRSVAAIPEGSGPPVVHCSAGVGRTGTYIVIDSMMKQIRDKASVNVYSFLQHIRRQRNYMVQTEEQYVFIHDVLLEYIQCGTTEVQANALTQYILDLQKQEGASTKLEQQYQLVVSYKPKDYEILSADLVVNKPKNRSEEILPVEISRVKLPAVAGELGSDYINASYFQGYFKRDEFIVTQHPLADTVRDFWRMVWDQNTVTIVLLSHVDDQECVAFWPEKDETVTYSNFILTFINENQQGAFTYRDFLLQSTQDDYECTTRLISPVVAWPERCSPLGQAFLLINVVKQWHSHTEVEAPVVVIDRLGGKEAATFCMLATLQDQLDHDSCVDVYLNAKLYHLKRPGVFPSEESYLLAYRAAEALCAEDSGHPQQDKDSGISCNNGYRSSLPPGVLPDLPPPAVLRSSSRNSAIRHSPINRTSTL